MSSGASRVAAAEAIGNLVDRTEALTTDDGLDAAGNERKGVLCCKCGLKIGVGAFVKTSKGEMYHQTCGEAKICGGCQEPIATGAIIEAMDKTFHAKCFLCSECKTDLSKCSGFASRDNKAMCVPCAEKGNAESEKRREEQIQAKAPVCGGCKEKITSGKLLKVFDEFWHPACFVCSQCSGALTSGVTQIDQKYMCGGCATTVQKKREEENRKAFQHQQEQVAKAAKAEESQYHAERGIAESCKGCGQKFTGGKVAQILGSTWHPDCFKCAKCKEKIGGEFSTVNDEQLCLPCTEVLRAEHEKKEASRKETAKEAYIEEQRKMHAVVCCLCEAKVVGEYLEWGGNKFCPPCGDKKKKGMGGK
eukprot:TRINITY_DN1229_c0_g4_i1.p1 TRINITY_DN1229_c0_g4~~TRINITY_DN1229_c0_g4_i1.p1  ORF type:complete len:372 (+),score=89.54 TRINITY_DN1229_c0_g4_i1:31-1116(+)